MDSALTVGISVIGTAGISFLAALYWRKRDDLAKKTLEIAENHEELTNRVAAIETQLALVGQTILPMSTAFQAILVKELTHFHTPEVDALLVKVGPPNILTVQEAKDLEVALEKRVREVDPLIGESERDAARMLPMVMKRAKLEAEVLGDYPVRLKLVTVAAATPNDVPPTAK
jgi:hypothetical protein